MDPTCEWADRVLASRAERMQHQQEIWDRMPEWYNSWVEHNDYVEKVLPHLLPLIHQHSSILEIGPGTGAFTIPLAHHCKQLSAVEPSPAMRTNLEANLRKHSLSNVQIHPARIEDSLQWLAQHDPFDMVLASHALYDVEDVLPVLQELIRHTNSLLILLGTGETPDWYRDLRRKLGTAPHTVPPQLDCLQPVLSHARISSKVHLIECTNNYVFQDEKAHLDWWMDKLNLEANDQRRLEAALDPLTEIKNGLSGIYSHRTNALVKIQGKNISSNRHKADP